MLSTSDRPFFEQVNVHEIKISAAEAARLNRSHLYKSSLAEISTTIYVSAFERSYKFVPRPRGFRHRCRRNARSSNKKKKRKKKHQPIPINYRVIYRRRIKHELVTRIRIHTCPERRDLRIISDLGYATFHARSRSRVSIRNRILHYAHATLNPNYFEPSVSHSLRQN